MNSSSQKKDSVDDASERAKLVLDYIIDEESEETVADRVSQVPVSKALADERIVAFESDRAQSRVLFITSDTAALNEGSWLMLHAQNICSVFAEVHIAVLTKITKKESKPTNTNHMCVQSKNV